MAHRLKIGDIIEISTSKGLAYAQYTHHHEQYGVLIRVLDGLFESRPKNFTELVKRKHKFVMFSPVQSSINKGRFFIVGHADIPEKAQKFPIFRDGLPDKDGNIEVWWLWDGEKEWRIDKLTPEQRYLPLGGIFTETALIHAIEYGWTPGTPPNPYKITD